MAGKQRTSTYKNRKGETIFFRNWITAAKPKSIIVIVHGLNSHSGYYHDFALQLNENGYEVYALDLPGRGRSDGERFYISDPLIENEKQPAKSMQQLLRASELLKERMPEITLPLFILHGTSDKVTMPQGSKYFMEHAGSIDKQLKLYEGHYHDLLHDKYNGIIIRDIIGWLREILGLTQQYPIP